jgi:hypothetical protein
LFLDSCFFVNFFTFSLDNVLFLAYYCYAHQLLLALIAKNKL